MPGPALILRRPRAAPLATIAVAAALLAGCQPDSAAGDPKGTDAAPVAAAGTGFDFYVLSLSWSPSFCAIEGADAPRGQCAPERDHAFIVHGLWPQFESGYPEFCDTAEPERVPDDLVSSHFDIMPSAGLIGHQWRKHGSCTGLGQPDYLRAVREARDTVAVPQHLREADLRSSATPDAVEAAFIAANDGLPPDGIAVTCGDGLMREVRICLTKGLHFRSCPEVDMRSCRAGSMSIPAAP